MAIKKLVVELLPNERIETGPVQVNDDFPGLFIRGDNILAFRLAISQLLVNPHDPFARMQVRAIVTLLDECKVSTDTVKEIQKDGIRKDAALDNSSRHS